MNVNRYRPIRTSSHPWDTRRHKGGCSGDVAEDVLWLERGGRSPIGRLSQLAKTLYNLQALVAVVDVVAFAYGAHLPAGELCSARGGKTRCRGRERQDSR